MIWSSPGAGRTVELPLVYTWRVATATRVFVLALVLGQLIAAGVVGTRAGLVVLGLAGLAAACAIIEQPSAAPTWWLATVEAVVASVLVGLVDGPVAPLSAYLVAPALVAGVRLGARLVIVVGATTLVTLVALASADVVAPDLVSGPAQLAAGLPWLATGTGVGLLAALQTRSVRHAAEQQAPYAAAHRLVAQLHALVHRRSLDLDVASLARAAAEDVGRRGAGPATLWVTTAEGALERLGECIGGSELPGIQILATDCIQQRTSQVSGPLVALPLRVGEEVFGALITPASPDLATDELLQVRLDELAVRLETALLVERIQGQATTEERNRLARDLHDGVAQRLVSLGLAVDELTAAVDADDPGATDLAESLRAEVTGIVQDLRFSVFDLRQDLEQAGGLTGALTEYAHELSRRSDLRVHFSLDERGPRLSRRTETELISIAREAIGNAHRHAGAINLWVTLTTDGQRVRLAIEDDGTGRAEPRPGHYGLHTMRERAERINADLAVLPRPDGGTVVRLATRAAGPAASTASPTSRPAAPASSH